MTRLLSAYDIAFACQHNFKLCFLNNLGERNDCLAPLSLSLSRSYEIKVSGKKILSLSLSLPSLSCSLLYPFSL